jgi:transposase InsO family protein
VDKFSKWIKAVPVTNQEATTAVKFFESIVYRYGVPNIIITDNGTNFTSSKFQEFAKKLGIKIKYASVAHPKSNGQVEKANGLICAGLKKRLLRPLKRVAGAWVEELPSVLWSLRTTPNSSMGYKPFFLLFGAEAVLPTDVRYRAPRVVAYVKEDPEKAFADAQDLLDEARDVALTRLAVYLQSICNYHSRRVRGRSFEPGNLILRLKQTSMSKLEPPWEGPYLVHDAIPGGAYQLCDPKTGKDIDNPWNA